MPYNDDDDNGGDDKLPAGGDRLAAILVHVGATRKGIKRLEDDVREVKDAVDDLRKRAVTSDDCNHVHDKLDREVIGLRGEFQQMQQELRRKPTGLGHPSVSQPQPQPPLPPTTSQTLPPVHVVEEVLANRQEKRRRSFAFWLSATGGLLGVLGTLIGGGIAFSRYLTKLDAAVAAQAAQADEIRRELARPRTVIVREQARPDAGPTPPVPSSSVTKKRRPSR